MPNTTTEPESRAHKTILVVDDHPMLRRGLVALIESEPDLKICGEATSRTGALAAIAETSPDLAIVDLALEGSDGLELIKDMKRRYPRIPALVLSMYEESVYAERCLRAGARGYLTKQELDGTVLRAIRCLLAGKIFMSEKLEGRLAARYVGGRTLETGASLDALSDRELQVFRLIGEGRATRQIANALHLSIKTIESHREHIKNKLTLESGVDLVHRATLWVDSRRTS